jgi:hypothetical protein
MAKLSARSLKYLSKQSRTRQKFVIFAKVAENSCQDLTKEQIYLIGECEERSRSELAAS